MDVLYGHQQLHKELQSVLDGERWDRGDREYYRETHTLSQKQRTLTKMHIQTPPHMY